MTAVERIFALLEERQISQKALAEYIGTRSQTINDWKTGKTHSYKKYIDKIADFFGVSADYILGNNPRDAVSDIFWATFINLCKKEGSDPITIGEHLGISPTAVASWGAGAMPAYSEMIMIAAYFNVTVGYLLGTENAAREQKSTDGIYNSLNNLTADEVAQLKDFLNYLEYKRGHQ